MNTSIQFAAAAIGIACVLAAFTLLPMLLSALPAVPGEPGPDLCHGDPGAQPPPGVRRAGLSRAGRVLRLRRLYDGDPGLETTGSTRSSTLPAAALVTGLVGVAIGLPALRLPGLQLAVVTFGIAAVVPQLLLKLEGITGGVMGIGIDPPEPPAWFPGGQELWLYSLCAAGCLPLRRA